VDAGGDRRLAAEHPFCRHPRTVIALGFCPPALCHSAQPAGGWGEWPHGAAGSPRRHAAAQLAMPRLRSAGQTSPSQP